jgi:hypothetical protein
MVLESGKSNFKVLISGESLHDASVHGRRQKGAREQLSRRGAKLPFITSPPLR